MDQDLEVLLAELEMGEPEMANNIGVNEGEMPLHPSSWHFNMLTREERTLVEVVPDSKDLEEVDGFQTSRCLLIPRERQMKHPPLAHPFLALYPSIGRLPLDLTSAMLASSEHIHI